MGEQVTFVTVGKLKGQTIAIGPDKKYQFVDGEMKVDREIAGLVARSLQFYSAFPKGDADIFHKAACESLNIDPETLQPIDPNKPIDAVEPAKVETKPDEPKDVPELPERLQKLRDCIQQLDEDDKNSWTSSGKPALPAVKALFGDDVSRSEVDAVWNVLLNED